MFGVTVRDHMMVAHSLRGEVFGPAQRLHGATYLVDVTFRASELDADGVVVDLGRAAALLHAVLADLTYRNLDEEPDLPPNTTTEVLARLVADRIPGAIRAGAGGAGPRGGRSDRGRDPDGCRRRRRSGGARRDAARVPRRVGDVRATGVSRVHVLLP